MEPNLGKHYPAGQGGGKKNKRDAGKAVARYHRGNIG